MQPTTLRRIDSIPRMVSLLGLLGILGLGGFLNRHLAYLSFLSFLSYIVYFRFIAGFFGHPVRIRRERFPLLFVAIIPPLLIQNHTSPWLGFLGFLGYVGFVVDKDQPGKSID